MRMKGEWMVVSSRFHPFSFEVSKFRSFGMGLLRSGSNSDSADVP